MRNRIAIVLSVIGFAAIAEAQTQQTLDCAKYQNIPLQDSIKQDPKAIHECMMLGWDPPVGWRPQEGKGSGINAGGAGGVSIGTVQAPDMPPWRSIAKSSGGGIPGSSGGSGPGFKFPPWEGWPFGSGGSSSSGGDSGGGATSCPTSNDDNDATFGVKSPLSSNVALACGGAAPLTTYELSLSANPDRLLITEYGYFNYWLYKKEGKSYTLISQPGATLPNKLCDGTALAAPVAQMISFSSKAASIALRLRTTDERDPLAPVVPPDTPEKRLILTQSSGALSVPEACFEDSRYAPTTALGDIVFDTVMSASCESAPEVCAANGIAVTPTTLPDCQIAVRYPTGANCQNKTQIILLDRPNLVYPTGSTATSIPVSGLTSVMLSTVKDSMIQTKKDWIVRLGASERFFVLPNGATVGLADGNVLSMSGPASINGNGNITLTQGGVIFDAAGNIVTRYAEGTTLRPNVITPIVMKLHQTVEMPAGYEVPSSPAAKVRLPITNP